MQKVATTINILDLLGMFSLNSTTHAMILASFEKIETEEVLMHHFQKWLTTHSFVHNSFHVIAIKSNARID